MLVLAFNVLGIVGLVAGVVALIRNRRDAHGESSRKGMAALGIGILLAAASVFSAYPLGGDTTIVGLPFTVAVFQGGADFVGPLTLPAWVGNTAFWFLFPQVVLWIARLRPGKKTRV